jgi:hypothetical protein
MDISKLKLTPDEEEKIFLRLHGKEFEWYKNPLSVSAIWESEISHYSEISRYIDFYKKAYSFLIEEMKEQYENEKNPLFVWEAYQIARKWDIPLPEWVLKYLDDAAEELLDRPPGYKTSEALFEAFKIPKGQKGQGSIFSRYENIKLGYRIVYNICSLRKEKPNLSLEEVFDEVRKSFKNEGIVYSEHNFKKWYGRLKKKVR